MLAFLDSETNAIAQYPIKVNDVKRRFPNTSFLLPLEDRDLENDFGVVTVYASVQPTYDSTVQKLVQLTPALVEGQWTQQWNVISFTEDEQARSDKALAAAARETRNKLLTEVDWTQFSDSGVNSADWTAYRQALRDVPGQSNFPRTITWPSKPS